MEFDALRLSLASPEQIRSWSRGEVLKPETINYRTFRAEKDGLFCEKIFGPTSDFKCCCGKYKGIRYKGVVCDKCGVEVTFSRVRRERMGHITLAAPIAHPWFFRRIPSQISLLLGISPRNVRAVVYFSSYLVTKVQAEKKALALEAVDQDLTRDLEKLTKLVGEKIAQEEKDLAEQLKKLTDLGDVGRKKMITEELELKRNSKIASLVEKEQKERNNVEDHYNSLRDKLEAVGYLTVLTDNEYRLLSPYLKKFSQVGMGARALLAVLRGINLEDMTKELRQLISKSRGNKLMLTKRLRVAEKLRQAGINSANMVMTILPVIPPDLRPMVQLEGGRFATSDLNDLYRRVINRNNRLKHLLELGAPQIIIHNEERMLQEAVDALLDQPFQKTRYKKQKELRSMSELLKGKKGRFRLNLLGKRVDYSGRAVIVVGPELRLYECGLPKEMALELFKPFVLRELMLRGLAPNVRSAKYFLDQRNGQVWDILEEIVKDHPVLLNRAPTLHSLSIQAFYPKLTEGSAIQLPPVVCTGFNADFDGDQMAVHVPLTQKAIQEAKDLMLSTHNLVRPAAGDPAVMPRREMLYGLFYLTGTDSSLPKLNNVFASPNEVSLAYESGYLGLRQLIKVKYQDQIIETTHGRLIFNNCLPEKSRFINKQVLYNDLRDMVVSTLVNEHDQKAADLIDVLKTLGLKYGTKYACSMSLYDCKVPEEKKQVLEEAEEEIIKIEKSCARGLITESEMKELSKNVWIKTTNAIDDMVWEGMRDDNPIKIMVVSKAKGGRDQVKQLAGMRGLIADPTGRIVEMPTKSSYREGLEIFEYFSGTRGGRKGLTDKALKTAEAGYLTRRLVDVAQDVIVRDEDCGTKEGLEIIRGQENPLTSFSERLVGRISLKNVKIGSRLVVTSGEEITESTAKEIAESSLASVFVRSPMTCKSPFGICIKCYGRDLITGSLVKIGRAVGVIAAQSIGEPGTQLTMKTFHTGGVVGKDITQGLPRVEEIFEARTPKNAALMSEITGKVSIKESEEGLTILKVQATDKDADISELEYRLEPFEDPAVEDGDLVSKGDSLTHGFSNIKKLLQSKGLLEAQRYILKEIQDTYSSQGVTLSDKHTEVIIRQMFSRLKVTNPGDTGLLAGDLVTQPYIDYVNSRTKGSPAKVDQEVLGITRASLCTESFLSAASFQNTIQVLTDAACSGSVDHLLGLKENVIIGRLIPTGERASIADELDMIFGNWRTISTN